jgi:hypothetical protein
MFPRIPQDQGLPSYTIYGARAEIKLRDTEMVECGVEGIPETLYAGKMTLAKIEWIQWAFNAEMAREVEAPLVPLEATLQRQHGNATFTSMNVHRKPRTLTKGSRTTSRISGRTKR